MAGTIFYSWQNDLDHKTHRNFIEKCIQKALKSVKKEAHVVVDYDRDTKGLNGSPDITATIFDKIEKSVLFVMLALLTKSPIKENPQIPMF